MNAGTCWGKNTIDRTDAVLKKPHKTTFTFFLRIPQIHNPSVVGSSWNLKPGVIDVLNVVLVMYNHVYYLLASQAKKFIGVFRKIFRVTKCSVAGRN